MPRDFTLHFEVQLSPNYPQKSNQKITKYAVVDCQHNEPKYIPSLLFDMSQE